MQNEAETIEIENPCGAASARLDVLVLNYLAADRDYGYVTRSQVKHWIEDGRVTVAGVAAKKAGQLIRPGEKIMVRLPPPELPEVVPSEMPLQILYEDSSLLAVNKPAGLSMHPGAGSTGLTLLNGLCWYMRSCPAMPPRCGLVHRLDKDTTGIVLVAKSLGAQVELSRQFSERQVKKTYLALVFTTPRAKRPVQQDEKGVISTLIGRHPRKRTEMAVVTGGGREAVTEWRRVEEMPYASLLEVYPKTGRTHQIRVHMQHIGSPIIGDPVHGNPGVLPLRLRKAAQRFGRQALHAGTISFLHPDTHQPITLEAAPPVDFSELLQIFRQGE